MDQRLSLLILDYQSTVTSAVRLMLEGGIRLPASNKEWSEYSVEPEGLLPGAITYVKHSYGCAVHLPGALVTFDFGRNGETNGFDCWNLQSFAAERIREYGFASDLEFETTFIEAVARGNLYHSGQLYYLTD
jgi:hypothetical protein